MDLDPDNWDSFIGSWTWTGRRNDHGYGQVRHNGRHQYAHRVSYTLAIGPIPNDMTVDHICWTPACVNPAHLQLLSHNDNCARQRPRGALTCKRGHPDLATNKDPSSRQCRTCVVLVGELRRWKRRNGYLWGEVQPCPLCGLVGDVEQHWADHMSNGRTWMACSECGAATESRTLCADCRANTRLPAKVKRKS